MQRRTKNIIITIGAIQLILILGIANLPFLVETLIPQQYWSFLPDFVVATTGVRDNNLLAVEDANVEVAALDLLDSLDEVVPQESESIEEENALAAAPTGDENAEAAPEAPEAEEAEATAEPTPSPTLSVTNTPAPPTPTFTPTPSPTPLPLEFKLTGLVNEPQKFNNCGPTNLSIMLRYYGDDTTQDEAAEYLKPNRLDRNVSPWQVSDYVNEFTSLRSITRSNGTQELLRELITAGFPVVIEKGYDPEAADAFGWYGHYLIMFGYDNVNEEYNTIDTFLGPFTDTEVTQAGYTLEDGLIYSYDYIANYWQQFNYTFYVVYEADREEELYAILGDDYIFTQDNWEAAIVRAEAEIRDEPENPYAWYNLGTSLTELGKKTRDATNYEKAAVAFDKARSIGLPSRMLWYQHGPFVSYRETGRYQDVLDLADATLVDVGGRNVEEVYLHKGHALSHLQDFEGALAAYKQALKLNENFYPAEFAIDYTQSLLDG